MTASAFLSFATSASWFNASGEESANFTHDNGTIGSPEPNSRAAVPSLNVAVNNTGFEISEAGQTFNVSLALHKYAGGYGGDEQVRIILFSPNAQVDADLTTAQMIVLGETDFSINGSWINESDAAFYTSTAADIGKTVFLAMELINPTGSVVSPRLDTLVLEVLAPE